MSETKASISFREIQDWHDELTALAVRTRRSAERMLGENAEFRGYTKTLIRAVHNPKIEAKKVAAAIAEKLGMGPEEYMMEGKTNA